MNADQLTGTETDRLVRDILELAVELQDLWHVENGDAVWSRTGSPNVTQDSTSPTEAAAERDRKWADRDRIGATLVAVRRQLENRAVALRPKHVTEVCRTRDCEGPATHGGYCFRCWRWRRNNPGLDPADMRGLVEQWNRARPRDCACSTECCPDGCWDNVEPGEGRISGRCRKRQYDARQRAG